MTRQRLRLLATLLVLVLASGCQWSYRRLENGTPLDTDDYHAIDVGEHRLADVVGRLGPPDGVTYTLEDEVLEYRFGLSAGSDLSFVAIFNGLPGLGQVSGLLRSVLNARIDDEEEEDPENPQRVDPLGLAIPFLASSLIGGTGFGSEQFLELQNERLRFDRIQVVIDRETGVVRGKSFEQATQPDMWRTTLLQE